MKYSRLVGIAFSLAMVAALPGNSSDLQDEVQAKGVRGVQIQRFAPQKARYDTWSFKLSEFVRDYTTRLFGDDWLEGY